MTLTGGPNRSGTRELSLDVLPLSHAAGAVAAFQAAAASLVAVLVPVVLTWLVTGGGNASWLDVVQMAAMLWLLAQHTGLQVDGGYLSLVPLGLTVVPLVTCAYAGTRLARSLDPKADRIAAGSSRSRPQSAPRPALLTMAIGHGLVGVLIASVLPTLQLRPVIWQAMLGPAVVALLGGAFGSAAYVHGGARAAFWAMVDALPQRLQSLWDPLRTVFAVQAAAALVVLLVAVVAGFGRIADLYAALGGGFLGALMITLMQITLLPNVLIWAAAWLTGPGFVVGEGSQVSLLSTTLGPLPALPILGALPDPGDRPGYWLVLLAVPVLAGAAGARRLPEPDPQRRWGSAQDLAALAVLSGVIAGVLAWLSGGPAGPGRLTQVGPDPLIIAAVFAGEVAVGGALLWLVRRGVPELTEHVAGLRARYRRGS